MTEMASVRRTSRIELRSIFINITPDFIDTTPDKGLPVAPAPVTAMVRLGEHITN